MPVRAAIATGFILMSVCACSGVREGRPEHQGESVWLREHARPIAIDAEGFDDLEFLRPLLEGKRIVQLGENAHGIREYNLIKARIVRYLHQQLGFGVLAFESALYQCYDADRSAADAGALTTLTGCAYGIWHTEEVLPLFEYLRESRQGAGPLRLAGIDVQPIGRNKADRPQFLSSVAAAAIPATPRRC